VGFSNIVDIRLLMDLRMLIVELLKVS